MDVVGGDILRRTEGVIIHQVNNKYVMNAGLAKDIRHLYPSHYNDYMMADMILGTLVTTRIMSSPKFFGIIGMIAQDGYGRDPNVQYTNEDAFIQCLIKIAELYKKNMSIKYYMPYKIGCGLGNGNWNEILYYIRIHAPFITLVKL